jgi:NADP-dependent 3-hydroxy acid dehydrogenase YdfG
MERVSGSLEGKSAVVSGASRGIGLAVARALTIAGARVTMLARSVPELEARASELGAQAITCDVADGGAVERAAADIREREGRAPDIIVNNAGLFRLARVDRTSAADFTAALAVNLVAPFRLIRAFLPEMRDRGSGHLVNIGSIADHMTFPENAAYSASKHGLRALHEVLRTELRGSGVRASLISPGPVDTPLWDPIDPDRREGFTPRGRMLAADGVAAAVCFVLTQPPEVNVDLLRLSRS